MTSVDRQPAVRTTIRQEVEARGYACLSTFCANATGEEVASAIGSVLSLGEGPAVHQLRPANKKMSDPNSYSGIYGLGAFPFHTDMAHWQHPPHFIMLRCIVGFEDVPTLLADGVEIVSEAERTGPLACTGQAASAGKRQATNSPHL
jgi:hypothetical protein